MSAIRPQDGGEPPGGRHERESGMSGETQRETRRYEAEVGQILDLMVRSLYGSKEIFLRELISNASDAADRLRFAALADDSLYEGDGTLRISIRFDREERTLTVADNGIGMSRDEVVENIGTIARSGTGASWSRSPGTRRGTRSSIGQFGVGFYSIFIVADRVVLTSRRAGAPAGRRGAMGVGRLRRVHGRDDRGPGARHGGDPAPSRGRGRPSRWVPAAPASCASTPTTSRSRSGWRRKAGRETGAAKAMMRARKKAMTPARRLRGAPEEETVNRATALWGRPRQEISAEEYEEFYKHVAHDFEAPLDIIHARIEGNVEYTVLLFVPGRAPFDLWDRNVRRGLRLYVRRVFILEDAGDLLPAYLRFVRGVVDASDLPLNVSREILQSNRQVEVIRSGTVKRVLGALDRLASDDEEKYAKFWGEFGKVLKEGVIEGRRQPGGDRGPPAVPLHRRRRRRRQRQRQRQRRAHGVLRGLPRTDEEGPGGDPLPHRRQPRRGPLEPASRGVPEEGGGGPAAGRPRRRMARRPSHGVRGQAASLRQPG